MNEKNVYIDNKTEEFHILIEHIIVFINTFIQTKDVKIRIYKVRDLLKKTEQPKQTFNQIAFNSIVATNSENFEDSSNSNDIKIQFEELPISSPLQTKKSFISNIFNSFKSLFFLNKKSIRLCYDQDKKYTHISEQKFETININIIDLQKDDEYIKKYLINFGVLYNKINQDISTSLDSYINELMIIYKNNITKYIQQLFNIHEELILNIGKILKDDLNINRHEALTYIILTIIFIISSILNINNINEVEDYSKYDINNIIDIINKNIILIYKSLKTSSFTHTNESYTSSNAEYNSNGIKMKIKSILDIIINIINYYIIDINTIALNILNGITGMPLDNTLPSLKKMISIKNKKAKTYSSNIDIKEKYRLLVNIIKIIKTHLK